MKGLSNTTPQIKTKVEVISTQCMGQFTSVSYHVGILRYIKVIFSHYAWGGWGGFCYLKIFSNSPDLVKKKKLYMKTLNIKRKRYIITKSSNHCLFFFFLNNFSYNIYFLRFFYQKKKKVNSPFLSMNFEMKTNIERINTGTFKLI